MGVNLRVYVLFAVLLAISACDQKAVLSQNNRSQSEENLNQSSHADNSLNPGTDTGNKQLAENTQSFTPPFYGPIKLPEKLKKEGLTGEDRRRLKELFKWNDVCDLDSNIFAVNENLASITFHRLAREQYLIEVMCQGGAYKIGYLFYHYDERRIEPIVKLVTFEWYESYFSSKTISRVNSVNPVGAAKFDDVTKRLYLFFDHREWGGEEVVFTFANSKATLIEMNETSDKGLKKLDIAKFRRITKKTRTVNAFSR